MRQILYNKKKSEQRWWNRRQTEKFHWEMVEQQKIYKYK